MSLNEADAQLMALKQSVKLSRARLENTIDKLEDLSARMVLPSQQSAREDVEDVIIDLKYTVDFILGEPKP